MINLRTYFNNVFTSIQFYSTDSFDNNNNIVPVKIYSNADTMKLKILKENRGKSGIYRWVHIESRKSYIGCAVDLTDRLYKYYSSKRLIKDNMIIYKAILKYGYSNFSFEILEYCNIDL